MKKIDLGQTIAILANLGVVAGIVFLGLELRQNNLYLQEEARNVLFQNRLDAALLGATDPEVARIWNWQETDEPLSELDKRRRGELIHANFLRWQHDYQSVQRGTLDLEDVSAVGMRAIWRITPGIDEVWEQRKARYSRDFVDWLEENVIGD